MNYFEFFYYPRGTDLDFRPEWPPPIEDRVRARFRNAGLLLELHYCARGITPTPWQHSLLPAEYREKVDVVFDGLDTDLWHPGAKPVNSPKIVTYAARGFEAMRGFDVFMKAANIISKRMPDVRFVVAGNDRVHYGGDAKHTGGKTYKEWVLSQGDCDLNRFEFAGTLPPAQLADLFRRSDLHIYLTAPFVLSWSLLNAMACGATVLASDTGPVRDVVRHGETGLLTDFFDADALAEKACEVLTAPAPYRPLGTAAAALMRTEYSLDACEPKLRAVYERLRENRIPQSR